MTPAQPTATTLISPGLQARLHLPLQRGPGQVRGCLPAYRNAECAGYCLVGAGRGGPSGELQSTCSLRYDDARAKREIALRASPFPPASRLSVPARLTRPKLALRTNKKKKRTEIKMTGCKCVAECRPRNAVFPIIASPSPTPPRHTFIPVLFFQQVVPHPPNPSPSPPTPTCNHPAFVSASHGHICTSPLCRRAYETAPRARGG